MSVIEPDQIWWSADELAASGLPELPGSVRGINLMATQYGWRVTPDCAQRKQGRGGGWRYHWSVLPLAARQKLLKEAAAPTVEPKGKLPRGEAWAFYDASNTAAKDKAKKRLVALQYVDALHLAGLSHVNAVIEAAKQAEASPRSVYNWLSMVEGVAPEDQLAYLVPRHKQAPRKSAKATCSRDFMDYLKGLYLRLERPTFASSHRLALAEAKRRGWDTLTQFTAKRHIDTEVPRVVQVRAREGVTGLMRCFPSQIRDRTTLNALEGVNADCHKIDVFVRWPDGKINRPQIVGFQDLFSGKILSWQVDNDPNQVMVMAAFGEMIETWGIPKHCLFDNGHEFANKWLTAGTNTRFRFKIREDDPLGVLPLLGIQVHWATPAHGQAKPVERAFRDFASDIAKHPRFHGAYVGNRPDAKPENYGNRAIPLEEFIEVLAEGVAEHNARQGRLSPTAQGRSFDETFAQSYAKAPIRKATDAQRRLWLMGQEPKKLHKQHGGLKLHGNEYHSEWMSEHANQKIVVRFDPFDLHSGAYIYATDGAFMGFAECRQKVGFFDLIGAKEEARRKARIKKANKALLEAHRPVNIEQIAATMAPETPEPTLVSAKVVTPEFRRKDGAPIARPPAYQPPENPALDAAQDALILNLPLPAKPSEPAMQDGFHPASDADARFAQAQDILERAQAGQPVGRDEANWIRGYETTSEYQGALVMAEHFDLGGAG